MTTHESALPAWPMPRSCPMLPPDQYAELRKSPPQQVRLDDGTTAWIISRYADIREAMLNPALSVNNMKPGFPQRLPIPAVPRVQSFMRMDAPEHTRLRRMVMPELTKSAVKAYRPGLEELVERLLDKMADGPKPADLLTAFAFPIPALTIAQILGVPTSETDLFQKQTLALTTCDVGSDEGAAAFGELTGYLDELIRAKKANPGDDLIGRLIRQYAETGQLEHSDLVAMVFLVLVAGFETTASQITLSTLSLIQNPAEVTRMLNVPGYADQVIDELLRYWSIPQDNQVRVVAEETKLGGVPVCPGDGVVFALSAANHDESVFADPSAFDPTREAHQHLAFGHGAHYCPGAPLARLEMEVALTGLFRRFPGLHTTLDTDQLSFRHDTVVYGLNALPVTW